MTYALAANIENLTLAGACRGRRYRQHALRNVLRGNSVANVLNGGAGADQMLGGLGNDTYVVDNAGDYVQEGAGAGTDTVQSSVTYVLAANIENLTLAGGAGVNATGNTLANVLRGNSVANVLNGGAGADQMLGGLGNDTYVVDNAGDYVQEGAGAGTDMVQSSVAHVLAVNIENLTLTGTTAINGTGNGAANVLRGNAAANVLAGGAGNDQLLGGLGADRLSGGLGSDRMTGGAAADVFVFAAAAETGRGAARDAVLDFAHGIDRLDLRGIDADSLHAGNQAFSFIGALGFSGAAGQLHVQAGILSGDLNGDRLADFEIALSGTLTASDMLL